MLVVRCCAVVLGALAWSACAFTYPADVAVVGGTVSGLWTGAAVTLRLTAGDVIEDVAVDGSTVFTFEHALLDGTSYLVTVADDGPDHDCVVTNGSGRVAGTDVGLAVECTNLIPHSLAISTPAAFTFDPRVTRYALPVSILQQGVEVVASGPTLTGATVAGQPVPLGQASPTVSLGQGTTTVPVVVSKDPLSQRYELAFERGGASIVEATYAQASNAGASDNFGAAVAAWGDYAAIGAPGEDSSTAAAVDEGALGSGAVYVFRRSGSTWIQTQILKGTAITAGRGFGGAVAMHRDALLVGARSDGARGAGAGAVYVFRLDAVTGMWGEEQRITASDAHAGDWFGAAVAVSGDLIAVGAPRHDRGAANGDYGVVYVLARTGGSWGEQATVRDPGTQALDNFGSPLALAGDTLVVGDVATNIRVFRGTGLTWTAEAVPPSCKGPSFVIESNVMVVGQPLDASGNGQPSDQSAPSSGAVRVYSRTGAVWSEVAYLKATSPRAQARMGLATAMQGNVIATTIPANNALQVFHKVGGSWVAVPPQLTSRSPSMLPIYGTNIALTAGGAVIGSGDDDGQGPAGSLRGTAWFFR